MSEASARVRFSDKVTKKDAQRAIKLLEYCLNDVLEMNYPGDQRTIQNVKEKLLARPINDPNLYAPPSFILEDVLVVIQNGNFKKIREVFFLKTGSESFKAVKISGGEQKPSS